MSVTIKDIALKAGVSRGTVDRVLHNRAGVNPEVAEKIRKLADEMGFVPNKAGKILAARKQPIKFACLLPARAKPFFEDVIKGFTVGADDYITKPYSLPELSLRINVHIKRNMKSEGFLVEYPPLKINIKTREVTLKEKPLHLTNREFDILCLLAETPNVIVPFTRIYSHVWGDDSPCDNHLVMVNISYLRKKMEKIAPEITFVKTEWGIGYSFAYPPVKNSMNTQY